MVSFAEHLLSTRPWGTAESRQTEALPSWSPHPEGLVRPKGRAGAWGTQDARARSWGWGVGERGEGTQHLPFHEDPGNL